MNCDYKYVVKIFDGSKQSFNRDVYVLEMSYYSKKEKDYVHKTIGFVDEDFLDYFVGKIFDNRKKINKDIKEEKKVK